MPDLGYMSKTSSRSFSSLKQENSAGTKPLLRSITSLVNKSDDVPDTTSPKSNKNSDSTI